MSESRLKRWRRAVRTASSVGEMERVSPDLVAEFDKWSAHQARPAKRATGWRKGPGRAIARRFALVSRRAAELAIA